MTSVHFATELCTFLVYFRSQVYGVTLGVCLFGFRCVSICFDLTGGQCNRADAREKDLDPARIFYVSKHSSSCACFISMVFTLIYPAEVLFPHVGFCCCIRFNYSVIWSHNRLSSNDNFKRINMVKEF